MMVDGGGGDAGGSSSLKGSMSPYQTTSYGSSSTSAGYGSGTSPASSNMNMDLLNKAYTGIQQYAGK